MAVSETHPKIYLTPARAAALQAAYTADNNFSGVFTTIKEYIDRRITNNDATASLQGSNPQFICECAALVANVTQVAGYINAAKGYKDVLIAMAPADSWDAGTRNRLLALSYIYDWLYDEFDAAEREAIRDEMYSIIDYSANQSGEDDWLANPDFINGHTRYGNICVFIACLTVYGEDVRFNTPFSTSYANITGAGGYNAVQNYIASYGGHQMGWKYGGSYTSPEHLIAWYTATGEKWCENFINNVGYWYIYAVDADGRHVEDNVIGRFWHRVV